MENTIYVTHTHGDEEPPYHVPNAIIANPVAKALGRRYVESDLNRSFNYNDEKTTYEVRRARHLKKILSDADVVVDIHRTTAVTRFCAIVTKLDDVVYALRYQPSAVIIMNQYFSEYCLIGNVKHGVVLEYPYTPIPYMGKPELYRVKGMLGVQKGWKELEPTHDGMIPYMIGEKAYDGNCFILERM